MAAIFAVVGEHQDDPARLLLLGEDGQHYQYDPAAADPVPAEPTDGWLVDPNPPAPEEVAG